MKAIVDSGISYGLGTDGVHGAGGMASEILCLLELGASPKTHSWPRPETGAGICGLEDVTGSIEPGKSADIIGVRANPAENVETLRDVALVVSRGEIIKFVKK